jgi:2-amino-4-hydroxy-6-hydroxymethyldihydropteridine diphosphokinase
MLEAGLDVIRLSAVYETEPVDFEAQPKFLNMIAELRGSTLPQPEQLMARLLRIEYAMLRRRDVKSGPRTLDLDLLLYKSEVRDSEFLTLPHPRLHLRRFVLQPLNDLIPGHLHPKLNQKFSELLANCPDHSLLERWPPKLSLSDSG